MTFFFIVKKILKKNIATYYHAGISDRDHGTRIKTGSNTARYII